MIYKKEINNYYNPNSKRVNTLFKYYEDSGYKITNNIENMPDFPYLVTLEFTNRCNLDCLFCSRAVMTRPIGNMDIKLFYKLIEEYRHYKTYIKVNGYGENLLHPNSLEFIKEIKKENGLYFTSNCSILNEKIAEAFIDSKLDVLQVSFQGLNEKDYESQRRGASFQKVIKNITELIKIRAAEPFPFIHLSTTILDESDIEIERFVEFGFELGVDSVGIGRTDYGRVIDELIVDKKRKKEIDEFRKRQTLNKVSDHTYLYKYSDVNWDGIVVSSFFDFNKFIPVGDLKKQTHFNIWNYSEVLNSLRILEKNKLLNKMKVFDTFYHAWHLGEKSYNLNNQEK